MGMHTHIYMYPNVCTHVSTRTPVCVYTCTHLSTHTQMCVHVLVSTCILSVHVDTYAYMYPYVCTHIYMYPSVCVHVSTRAQMCVHMYLHVPESVYTGTHVPKVETHATGLTLSFLSCPAEPEVGGHWRAVSQLDGVSSLRLGPAQASLPSCAALLGQFPFKGRNHSKQVGRALPAEQSRVRGLCAPGRWLALARRPLWPGGGRFSAVPLVPSRDVPAGGPSGRSQPWLRLCLALLVWGSALWAPASPDTGHRPSVAHVALSPQLPGTL